MFDSRYSECIATDCAATTHALDFAGYIIYGMQTASGPRRIPHFFASCHCCRFQISNDRITITHIGRNEIKQTNQNGIGREMESE